jgi:hypothetical protein
MRGLECGTNRTAISREYRGRPRRAPTAAITQGVHVRLPEAKPTGRIIHSVPGNWWGGRATCKTKPHPASPARGLEGGDAVSDWRIVQPHRHQRADEEHGEVAQRIDSGWSTGEC